MVHLGFLFIGWGLYRLYQIEPAHHGVFALVLGGAFTIYFGLVLTALFLYLPVAPWIRRYHALRQWREWLWSELPTILALVPILIALAKLVHKAWDEIKKHYDKDSLDLSKLAKVVAAAADEADEIIETKNTPPNPPKASPSKRQPRAKKRASREDLI